MSHCNACRVLGPYLWVHVGYWYMLVQIQSWNLPENGILFRKTFDHIEDAACIRGISIENIVNY